MIPIDDEQEIITLAMQRANLEMDLARALYNFFNSPPQITYLRNLLDTAITSFVADLGGAHRNFAQRNIFEVAVKKAGKKLDAFKRRGLNSNVANLELLLQEKNNWTAADCSDLICLFGELVENKMLKGNYGYEGISPTLNDQKAGWRPELHFDKAHRARLRDAEYESAQSAPHVGAAHAVMAALRRDEAGFAGMERTMLNRSRSTVFKIDFVYGLPEGCDISGTTADSLFFHYYLEPFCTITDVPPWMFEILHLLPIATMVYQAHHTLLECALTISLNRRTGVEYSVGKYSTLLNTPVGGLNAILNSYENDYTNHRMLCYFRPGTYRVKANYYDSWLEWDEFHRISTFRNDQFLMTKFMTAPVPVTQGVLRNIFDRTWLQV